MYIYLYILKHFFQSHEKLSLSTDISKLVLLSLPRMPHKTCNNLEFLGHLQKERQVKKTKIENKLTFCKNSLSRPLQQ